MDLKELNGAFCLRFSSPTSSTSEVKPEKAAEVRNGFGSETREHQKVRKWHQSVQPPVRLAFGVQRALYSAAHASLPINDFKAGIRSIKNGIILIGLLV